MSDTSQQTRRRNGTVEPAEDQQQRRRGVESRAQATFSNNDEAEARMAASTPTPTQEENDLAKVGALEQDALADDGSGPDPNQPPVDEMNPLGRRRRQLEPGGAAGRYNTRAAAPAPAPQPAPAPAPAPAKPA
jgi:hypothetical protein